MFAATIFRGALLSLAVGAAGCVPKGPARADVAVPAVSPSPTPPPSAAVLAPATEEERALEGRLKETVEHLARDIGDRNVARSWNLASATDDLARTLEKMGYLVTRQGIVVGEDVVQNLEVASGGGDKGNEIVFVAAHFDTASGSPGADDDASGVAAVVELARAFRDRKTKRTVRFSLLSNGEAPHVGTEHAGSLVFGKGMVQRGDQVVGGFCLDGLGVYRTEAKSEHPSADALGLLPDVADFVAAVGTEKGRAFYDAVLPSLKTATLPVVGVVVPEGSSLRTHGACAGFDALGFPTVTVTDTGPFRYPHHHQKTDLPEELDFGRLSRVVSALGRALAAIADS
ncbi:MAG TPA: M28 family peptidase [Polyangiaceae bacterium]|nr:M28 family peptidase [Polyangiaceae bacterium]